MERPPCAPIQYAGMEPRLAASEASVASQMRSICECASCAPAKGMITSDGKGMQADCTAISTNTMVYFAAAERPTSPINSLENIALSISSVQQELDGCVTPELHQTTAERSLPGYERKERTARTTRRPRSLYRNASRRSAS